MARLDYPCPCGEHTWAVCADAADPPYGAEVCLDDTDEPCPHCGAPAPTPEQLWDWIEDMGRRSLEDAADRAADDEG